MAVGGVLGDLIGIRAVYLAAAVLVVVAAGISFLVFRGVPVKPPATMTEPEAGLSAGSLSG
jgi:hypothetical protein